MKTKSSSMTVDHYLIQVPRVGVRIKVRKVVAETLAACDVPLMGSVVANWTYSPGFEIDALGRGEVFVLQRLSEAAGAVLIWGGIQGFRTATVALEFEAGEWASIVRLADHLEVDAADVVRAALGNLFHRLRRKRLRNSGVEGGRP